MSHSTRKPLYPCPAGDNCALNYGAMRCFSCGRSWPPDKTWQPVSAAEGRQGVSPCGTGVERACTCAMYYRTDRRIHNPGCPVHGDAA
jgi:hypothetical protein